MASEIGQLNVRVGLDSTGFQNGISSLNREMKKVQSEFKLAQSQMAGYGKELDGLKLKSDNLTKQTELQRQKVQALEAAHKKSVETKGKDARATQDLEVKLNKARTQLNYMEKDLKDINRQIEVQSSNWYQLGKTLEASGQKMQAAGQKMESVGRELTTKVSLPLAGLGAAAVKVGSDFEAGMSEVQAISGAAGADLEKLKEKAKEMGATTRFSAAQSAEALKYMAMAGWDTTQMLEGLDGVMMLAAASGESLGTVSDIVTDALTAFGMQAGEAADFADLLASTSSKANTNVSMLGESFKYVAPLFGSLGYSAEDAVLALGLMANAGIKASQAGTSLRSAVTNLANPTAAMAQAMNDLGLSITDANGEMLPFKDVMDELREKFAGLSQEQQTQYAATIFGKEAMSGMLAVINAGEEDYAKLTRATREYNGAAEEMAGTMEDNLQGELTKLKSALEGVGIQIFEVLLPHLNSLVEKIQEVVEWFASLSPQTQEAVVKIGLLAAAIGPLLLIGGQLIGSIGSIIGVFSKLSLSAATASTATGGMAAGFSAAGMAAKAGALLLNPWVLGIGAATVAGVALYKHLQKESIPAVELFGDKVSESTKKAVGGFLELNDEATLALNQLSWSGQEVTKKMADNIAVNFSEMADKVQAGLDKHHEESLAKIQGFVNSSISLSKEEQDEILNNLHQGYEKRKQRVADGEARIKEILQTASEEKRALTKAEQEEINSIQREMVNTGIEVLSENEVEAKAIMERMKAHAGKITALQAAEVVKNSLKQKEESIKVAEEQCKEVIKEIIRQRDEAGTITEEQAEKLIREATRQRDESIKRAKEMHQKVVEEAKAQAQEHINQVDWETGEIKSKWQVMKDDIIRKAREIKEDVSRRWEEIRAATKEKWTKVKDTVAANIRTVKDKISEGIDKVKEWNATEVKEKVFSIVEKIKRVVSTVGSGVPANFSGTSFFPGGLTMVGELGPELVELPRGSRIYNDRETKEITGSNKGITQNITINTPTSLTPAETARQIKNASRQLALEW